MCNFEGHLIHIGSGNFLPLLALCSRICVEELVFNLADL